MTKRVYNFSAGPATLPLPVLERIHEDLLSYQGSGMSVMEMSHRSQWIGEIFATAEQNLRRLLNISDAYDVLFLQGGARMQFAMIPMNFLAAGQSADYILTGAWGKGALKEAQGIAKVRLAWSGEQDNFKRAPLDDELDLDKQAAFLHYTSNETIQGVEFASEPSCGDVPLVCDMSSDFISRPIDVSKYSLIYAGAQKNAGPAGVTMVILNKAFKDRIKNSLPQMLDYRVHAEKKSLYNTPPVFSVYVVSLVTQWLLDEIGGLDKVQELNQKKADILYKAIDESDGFYTGHAEKASRSLMNVTWRLPSEDLEKQFVSEAKSADLLELKGHRSVGGIRASIYNAMPIAGVETLSSFMQEFKQQHG